jgi:hypothetical protein
VTTSLSAKTAAPPPLLSLAGAAFTYAKKLRKRHWYMEIAAASSGVIGAFVPSPVAAALLGIVAVVLKGTARVTASKSRGVFRQAERARRYQFARRTMGWKVPEHVYADLRLAFAGRIENEARDRERQDATYYSASGPPSTAQFFQNLGESIFWTERLMAAMEGHRTKHITYALLGVAASLVGLVLVQPSGAVTSSEAGAAVLAGLKVVGTIVSVLVALDLLGERSSFARGARECRDLFCEVKALMAAGSRDEGVRIMVEYNCLLADLPMIPDDVYEKNKERLTRVWTEVAQSLPPECA